MYGKKKTAGGGGLVQKKTAKGASVQIWGGGNEVTVGIIFQGRVLMVLNVLSPVYTEQVE